MFTIREFYLFFKGVIHKLRYNVGKGQEPGRYNIIYGLEYFKNLEKMAKIGVK